MDHNKVGTYCKECKLQLNISLDDRIFEIVNCPELVIYEYAIITARYLCELSAFSLTTDKSFALGKSKNFGRHNGGFRVMPETVANWSRKVKLCEIKALCAPSVNSKSNLKTVQ